VEQSGILLTQLLEGVYSQDV